MLYKELEIGDYVYDPEMEAYGYVEHIEDIHNIIVEFDDGGKGIYCLDPKCSLFDNSLKIIKRSSEI
jgi:hypothetical protein